MAVIVEGLGKSAFDWHVTEDLFRFGNLSGFHGSFIPRDGFGCRDLYN